MYSYSLTKDDMRVLFGFLISGVLVGMVAATPRILGAMGFISGTIPH